MTKHPMYEMNPRSRFSSRAENYAKYRPSYSPKVIDRIIAELDNGSESVAADIGAGTGISSRLLADRGIKVLAIEPNAAMRQVAIAHPLVEFSEASAEDTNLPNTSVDLVTCFQAFHWFNPKSTLKEFARILKPKGKLAAVWNNRHQEDEFTREYSLLTKKVSNSDSELRYGTEKYLLQADWFNPVRHFVFPYRQSLSLEALIGRAMSTSYIPQEGKIHEEFIKDLIQLYRHYCNEKNLVYLQYQTSVYLTELSN